MAVGRGESSLEAKRLNLCRTPSFSPASAFQRLDRDATGFVNGSDIWNFLRDRYSYCATISECDHLVKFFDSDNDGVLSLSDFQQMLLTCEDNYTKDVAIGRYPMRVGRFDRLPADIEFQLQSIIDGELALMREIESLKRILSFGSDYSAVRAFDTVQYAGKIDSISLRQFLDRCLAYALPSDIQSMIRRIDLDGDQLLTLSEWETFLSP